MAYISNVRKGPRRIFRLRKTYQRKTNHPLLYQIRGPCILVRASRILSVGIDSDGSESKLTNCALAYDSDANACLR